MEKERKLKTRKEGLVLVERIEYELELAGEEEQAYFRNPAEYLKRMFAEEGEEVRELHCICTRASVVKPEPEGAKPQTPAQDARVICRCYHIVYPPDQKSWRYCECDVIP